MPDISIISVEYHDAESLHRFEDRFSGLEPAGLDAELIVVRNDTGTNGSSIRGRVTTLNLPTNTGFAYAFGKGVERSTGKIIASCNLDLDLTPELLTATLEHLGKEPAAIVGPRLYNATGEGGLRRFPNLITLALLRTPLRPRLLWSRDAGPGWLLGAYLAATRETWIALGGLDTRFFLYFEDADFSWRAIERGHPVRVLPVSVYHAHGRASTRLGLPLLYHLRSAWHFFMAHPAAIIGRGPSPGIRADAC